VNLSSQTEVQLSADYIQWFIAWKKDTLTA